jgi:hypothetical protein
VLTGDVRDATVGSGDEHETDGELGGDDVDEDVEVPFVIAAGELAADMEDLLAVETFFDTDSVLACLRGGEEGSGLDRFIAVEDVFKERALSMAEVTAVVVEDIAVADALEGADEARGREMEECESEASGTIDN